MARTLLAIATIFIGGTGCQSDSSHSAVDEQATSWTTEDFYVAIENDNRKSVAIFLSDRSRSSREYLSYHLLDHALKLGKDQIVSMMIDAGAGIDTFLAVQHESLPAVKQLLEKGANPVGASLAAQKGAVEMLKLLLSHGESQLDSEGAAKNGQIEALKLLLDAGVEPNGLGFAVLNKHIEIARLLLENGADPNKLYRGLAFIDLPVEIATEYFSPLHYAVINQDIEAVQLLLDYGANPNVSPSEVTLLENRGSRLDLAFSGGTSETNSWPTVLQLAIDRGVDPEILQLLRSSGAVSQRTESIDNIELEKQLYRAANRGSYDTVVELLYKGANPTGLGSFFYAYGTPYKKRVIRAFLEAGADPNSFRGNYFYSPAAIALMNGDVSTFGLIFDSGARSDEELLMWYMKISSNQGLNDAIQKIWELGLPLGQCGEFYIAVNHGNTNTVEFLLAKGARPVALRSAVERKRTNIVRMLLDSGADPNASDQYDERSILELAVDTSNQQILEMLQQAGATY